MEELNTIFIVILLALLLGFSAFFSGSETALMALSKLRFEAFS